MNQAPSTARLLADVGGTNARFAWQAGPGKDIESVLTLPCAEHVTLEDAVLRYLRQTSRTMPRDCAIAIANPVTGDRIAMTNHHWAFSIRALKTQLGLDRLLVVNDFTALALALPKLGSADRWQLGGEAPEPSAAIGLIGPGTGLGVSGLLPDGRGGWLPIQGEGGHGTLGPTTSREAAVLTLLRQWHGHVSAERAVCGQGLVDIYSALQHLDNTPGSQLPAAEVADAAIHNRNERCVEALNLFCSFLGIAAGNLALTLGARGGVYIGGGIVPRLGRWFASSPFRASFEAKGRFAAYLKPIPVYVIDTPESPAFLGAAEALDSELQLAGLAR
ncbi:glucokinase [Piscinibacterium candidicorallinum]|uniref:Glucokinase n=1 Tax=Piscinibacterium candidicorallinum TaxID=1793872 RepID=A0ABV7H365_9BURK